MVVGYNQLSCETSIYIGHQFKAKFSIVTVRRGCSRLCHSGLLSDVPKNVQVTTYKEQVCFVGWGGSWLEICL